MNTLIIIIILLLLSIFLKKKYIEGFDDFNPNMLGYEEGLPNEYRGVDYKTLEYLKRNDKEFIANNWHLRFPYMVNTRYSYDDVPDRFIDYTNNPTYVRLKELPLQMEVDQNYIPLPEHDIRFQRSNARLPCDLHRSYIDSNGFLDARVRSADINGFDYNSARRPDYNAGNGTSDSFYLEDRGY